MANGFVQIACIREIPGWKAAGDHWAQLPCSSWATWSRLCSTAFSQVGFEHLQGWRPLILSAQPFSVFDHPRSAKSVSLCSDGSSRFSLCPLPATWHATEKNLPQLHFLLPGVFYALRFPMSLLSSSSLSLSCQMLQTVSDLCSPASASPSPPCTAEHRTGQGISDTASPVLSREQGAPLSARWQCLVRCQCSLPNTFSSFMFLEMLSGRIFSSVFEVITTHYSPYL